MRLIDFLTKDLNNIIQSPSKKIIQKIKKYNPKLYILFIYRHRHQVKLQN